MFLELLPPPDLVTLAPAAGGSTSCEYVRNTAAFTVTHLHIHVHAPRACA